MLVDLTAAVVCCGVSPQAQAVQPGLEDGYVWLMKSSGQEVNGI